VFGPKGSPSIFVETYSAAEAWKDDALLARWARIAAVRGEANRKIEALRAEGRLGSSLQAQVTVKAGPATTELLRALGDDLRFVLISSAARIEPLAAAADAHEFFVEAEVATAPKCERCWHYRADVGHDPAHPTICGRCTANLFGAGEPRTVA
jgi:isoleucyl-tRNA synthetase